MSASATQSGHKKRKKILNESRFPIPSHEMPIANVKWICYLLSAADEGNVINAYNLTPQTYSGIPEYRTVKKLGERQIIHRWNRNDV